jgi:D-beta-D-heptose 7-phosphate kinase/D-beta-D-heptose 1-phosphate adenosyltransferase
MAFSHSLQDKILTAEQLFRRARGWEVKSHMVAFTNGCFDLLHVGHLDTLAYCADHANRVVVGLNSDASVRRLKGDQRPIVGQKERALMLAAMQCVSAVVIFDADTPLELIKGLRPNLLVKGGDWEADQIVGADEVKANGGTVHVVPFRQGWSTTALAERLAQS